MLRIGFQGDRGSFSEGAARSFGASMRDVSVAYVPCYTTDGVLRALERREVTYGVFAIYNSRAGIVKETVAAIGRYRFNVVDVVTEAIRQNVLALRGQTREDIQCIIGHPVALAQSRNGIARQFEACVLDDGREQGFSDGAVAARALASGALAPSMAVLGSAMLAEIYNLEIIARDVHDDDANKTTFLCVQCYEKKR